MVRIQSNKELTISKDSRSGNTETGIIEIEITSISFKPKTKEWQLIIEDYLTINNEADPENGTPAHTSFKKVNKKLVSKSAEEMNGLFALLGSIDSSEKFNERLIAGLLYDTQNNPVYDSTASDWQIKE